MYKIRGQIKKLERLDIEFNNETHKKVLLTIEETDSGFSHTQQFEIFGETKLNVIEHSQELAEEKYVRIEFYIKSREYNGRWYNNLQVKECIIENGVEMPDLSFANNDDDEPNF